MMQHDVFKSVARAEHFKANRDSQNRPRLTPDTLHRLGKQLRAYHGEVLTEELPAPLALLLGQLA